MDDSRINIILEKGANVTTIMTIQRIRIQKKDMKSRMDGRKVWFTFRIEWNGTSIEEQQGQNGSEWFFLRLPQRRSWYINQWKINQIKIQSVKKMGYFCDGKISKFPNKHEENLKPIHHYQQIYSNCWINCEKEQKRWKSIFYNKNLKRLCSKVIKFKNKIKR